MSSSCDHSETLPRSLMTQDRPFYRGLAELAELDAELAKTDDARAANDKAPHEIAA
jgi:hypothetical protein